MLMWWAKYPRKIEPTKFAPPHIGSITCLLPRIPLLILSILFLWFLSHSNGDNDLPSLFPIFHWNTICTHFHYQIWMAMSSLWDKWLFSMTSPLSSPHSTQLSNIFPFSIWLAGWLAGNETGDSFHFKNKIN